MALDFPGSPTPGQTYTYNDITYYWDATNGVWKLQVPTVPLPVGNTTGGVYSDRTTTRSGLNFIEGSGITIAVDDDPNTNHANITIVGAAGDTTIAEAAFDKANAANIIGESAFIRANLVWDSSNTVYTYAANSVMSVANAAFAQANAANLIPVGNTIASNGYFTNRATRRGINFIEGSNITINIDDDPVLNLSNITITSTGGAGVTTADAAPGSPTDGDLWWNSTNGKLYVYYDDGDTSQWVEASPGEVIANGAAALASAAYDKANTANLIAENAFIRANTVWDSSNSVYTYAANNVMLAANSAYAAQNTTYTYAANNVMLAANTAYTKANLANQFTIAFVIDGGGSAITTGLKGTIEVPYKSQITRWTILLDQSGSANVDMWSRDYSTTLPTPANSVTGNIGMTISTATANQSTDMSNWRMTTINAGNVITYNVQSISTATRATVSLFCRKLDS